MNNVIFLIIRLTYLNLKKNVIAINFSNDKNKER
jgi:hypothetical protein